MEGLENLTALEEIYLSHNGIERIEGLEKNVRQVHIYQIQMLISI